MNHEQAVYFLEHILELPTGWNKLLQSKPLDFLTVYMRRHGVRVPFQNVDMTCVPPSERWFPSEADLIRTGLAGVGGCCINLNYFTHLVFRAVGLDSFVVRGDHFSAPVAGTHCMVMARISGEVYLVEVGGACPIQEPVPMSPKKLPYRARPAGGFIYEFREVAPGWIGKVHLKGGLMGGPFVNETEKLRTTWDLKPRALWEFDYPMLETFTNPVVSSLLRHPLLCRYFGNDEYRRLFPDDSSYPKEEIENEVECVGASQNFVFVFKRRVVIGDERSRKIVRNYESFEEMRGDLKTYFPYIPGEKMDQALEMFNGFEVKPTAFDGVI